VKALHLLPQQCDIVIVVFVYDSLRWCSAGQAIAAQTRMNGNELTNTTWGRSSPGAQHGIVLESPG
jgi:hypothetical protein